MCYSFVLSPIFISFHILQMTIYSAYCIDGTCVTHEPDMDRARLMEKNEFS